MRKPFLSEQRKTSLKGAYLPVDNRRRDPFFIAVLIPLKAFALRKVENERDTSGMVFSSKFKQAPAILGIHVGGINHGEPPPGQPS